jgi:RNA recognition motif-containing protein
MKLLIRNLARTTTEADLRKKFEAFGPIQSCSLVKDKQTGKSKGFGFIEMPSPGDAKAAVKTLNGKELDGNIIRVKKAAPKKSAAEKHPEQKPGSGNAETEMDTIKPEKPEPETVQQKNTAINRNIWSSND